ncbi:MAG: YdcF family protein [Deltaproteobacteria bacterium]|nr:YdcF family protein [Deltaproteobacteria bacterium]MBW2532220.1 YdcF family protein [Deltaproteobacteria bacterium]
MQSTTAVHPALALAAPPITRVRFGLALAAALCSWMTATAAHATGSDAAPTAYDVSYFDDAAALEPQVGDEERLSVRRSLLRAQLAKTRPHSAARRSHGTRQGEQTARELAAALDDESLQRWIETRPSRRRAARRLALRWAPSDPGHRHNREAAARIRSFEGWERYPYDLIVVPGYTPRDATIAQPGVHEVAQERLRLAAADLEAGLAPFILVSGANVYPQGTPYYEALEMKSALIAMGVPSSRIVVDARARHTTTNLRNAGRFMLAHGLRRALIVTTGGGVAGSEWFDQYFYLSNPYISTFHARCERELGYRVGTLVDLGRKRIAYSPSAEVHRVNYRDPLDP